MIELLQATLPWRDFDWVDGLANLIGSAFGASLALAWPHLHLIKIGVHKRQKQLS
jgi:VanZ family protein